MLVVVLLIVSKNMVMFLVFFLLVLIIHIGKVLKGFGLGQLVLIFIGLHLLILVNKAVLQREIFASGTADDEIVFGYQEYAADYRFKPARLSGLFRPNATNSLDAWHLAQDFMAAPELNAEFIAENLQWRELKLRLHMLILFLTHILNWFVLVQCLCTLYLV